MCQQMIQDMLDARGVVDLPSCEIELSAPLIFRSHTIVRGAGAQRGAGNVYPGTRFVPATGYTGPGCQFDSADDYLHGLVLQDVQFANFASHGVELNKGMGENTWIGRVSCNGNGGDGFHITDVPNAHWGTPANFGMLSVHGNAGAGLRIAESTLTAARFEYLSMDNNGEAGMVVEKGWPVGSIYVAAWKSERANNSGQPIVFKFNYNHGQIIHIGPGRVMSGGAVTQAGHAVFQVNQDTRLICDGYGYDANTGGGGTDYTYGFEAPNESPAVTRSAVDLANKSFRWNFEHEDILRQP